MYLIFLFFFSYFLLDFFILIFPSSFWGLGSNFFFLFFFLTSCFSFNIWRSSLPRSSWLGWRFFFVSLELSSLLSVVFFFGRGSTVVFFFFVFCFFACLLCFVFCLVFFVFFGIEVFFVYRTFSLSHLKQQSPKMDFHHF